MDLDFTWELLSSNEAERFFWLYGFSGTNTTEPVAWDFYYSLVSFLDTLPTEYPATIFNVLWNAYIRVYDIEQTPSLYQGCLPKYKFGSWAKSYAGLVFDQGFINYQYQYLCSGRFNTQQELYTPYGDANPFFPTTGIIGAEYLSFITTEDIQGEAPSGTFGDAIYTQIEVPAFQELFLYVTVYVNVEGDASIGYILL